MDFFFFLGFTGENERSRNLKSVERWIRRKAVKTTGSVRTDAVFSVVLQRKTSARNATGISESKKSNRLLRKRPLRSLSILSLQIRL